MFHRIPQHLKYHFTSNVEMPAMMCDYYAHTQDRQFLREILYLHVLEWPGEQLKLPALPKKIVASSVLTGGQVSLKEDGRDLFISLPTAQRDKVDTIMRLELEEPL